MGGEGKEIYAIAARLFPICRSITGNGVRESLNILTEYAPDLRQYELASGTQVFDWTIPKEWNVKGGGIWKESGEAVLLFSDHNLHIMGYSVPVDRWVDREELKKYIYVQEDQPEVIPYVTSYYNERFGFCMSKKMRDSLQPGNYHIVIDSELKNGSLTYGEVLIPGGY